MAHVADHLSVLALEQQYRSCTDVTTARHFQTIWLLAKGHEIAEVSATGRPLIRARRPLSPSRSRPVPPFSLPVSLVSSVTHTERRDPQEHGLASHSRNLVQRRFMLPPRTAMATARFWPTNTTSRLPLVTPV